MHPLDGVREKVRWARTHLEALNAEVREWVAKDSDCVSAEKHPEADVIAFHWFPDAPHLRWGVMYGNIIHNLRSALDHLVWQMVKANEVIEPRTRPFGHSFPIRRIALEKGATFAGVFASRNGPLESVHADHLALIEKFQPYQVLTRGLPAEAHELAALDEFWQIDKHRHLNLTQWMVPPGRDVSGRFELRDQTREIVETHVFSWEGRRLDHGAVLAWVQVPGPRPYPDVEVEFDLPLEPVVERSVLPPAYDPMPLGPHLFMIGSVVGALIDQAARIPPF